MTPLPANRVTNFLDGLGDDSKLRPRPALRLAVSGIGGAALALGVLIAVVGDTTSRSKFIVASLILVVVSWVLRMWVKPAEVKSASVGMAVVAIPVFAIAVTVSDGRSIFLTGLLMAALLIAAWAFPGFKGRNLLLGLGALALVSAFGSLSSNDSSARERCDAYQSIGDYDSFDADGCYDVYNDSSGGFLPTGLTENLGTQGVVYLVGATAFLGLTWWLDRRRYHGVATALCAAGLVSAFVGTGLLANELSRTAGPILVLVVGVLVCVVGTHGARRATTWLGATLAAGGLVALVAVQWDPAGSGGQGGVLIVSGLLLMGISRLVDTVQSSIGDNRSDTASGQ